MDSGLSHEQTTECQSEKPHITLNTGAPQGCVLSPALLTLFTHDCKPIHSSNTIVRFADDTTVVGLISGNDETHYREEVQHLVEWCMESDLVLNTTKTKEILVDYRRTQKMTLPALHINGAEVERVNNIKFLGLHITKDLTWTNYTTYLVKKTQQRLFFLSKLKKAKVPSQLLPGSMMSEAERKGKERKGKERKGKERKGKERKGKERKGKERKGKERKGKERKGKERKGKERKGKERKGRGCSSYEVTIYKL
ncbi:hypothetical protein QTP86_033403, partial [Hemibagrus guttatus]